jgi:hypothetical protein
MMASLTVLAVSSLPAELGVRQELSNSQVAAPLAAAGREALSLALQWSGVQLEDVGLPSSFFSADASLAPLPLASSPYQGDNRRHENGRAPSFSCHQCLTLT